MIPGDLLADRRDILPDGNKLSLVLLPVALHLGLHLGLCTLHTSKRTLNLIHSLDQMT